MTAYICVTCGTQFAPSETPPASCPICLDPRQYVGHEGQRFTTLDELARTYHIRVEQAEPGLTGIGIEPSFAIGQRGLLGGGLLWDCVPLVDDETARVVEAAGGLHTIAISHPHYYSSMVEWAHRFGCPIHLHVADAQWVMRPDPAIRHWDGERLELGHGLTLIRGGGHFRGGRSSTAPRARARS
jgi:hypothetical protein